MTHETEYIFFKEGKEQGLDINPEMTQIIIITIAVDKTSA